MNTIIRKRLPSAASAASVRSFSRLSSASAAAARDVVIVGSGPAGYTAATYAARALLKPLVLAGYAHGGQLMLTSDVENFPGYADPVAGPVMMEDLRRQAERFGAEILERDVTAVDFSHRPFTITYGSGDVVRASAVIVATGARALWLNAPGEELVRGRGVSTCATCDGAFFRGQHVMVVGGGDAAMEEALFLTRFASKVTVVHRSDRFRASRVMLERAQRHPKIDILPFRRVSEWLVDETQGPFPTLKGAVLEDPRRTEAGRQELACSGAFVAIGHAPVTGLFAGQLKMDEDGYIVHRKRTMTSVAGVFAAGDVVDKVYRQAITAAGMGCQAAMDAERWLSEIRAEEEQAARGVI